MRGGLPEGARRKNTPAPHERRVAYNAEQFDHQQAALSWLQYVATPDF